MTLVLAQLFCWTGILLGELFDTPYHIPFFFGIAIPVANWGAVKNNKWLAMFTMGLVAFALFLGAGALAIAALSYHVLVAYAVIGLSGVAFLYFNSAFISTIHTNWRSVIVTFLLVASTIPFSNQIKFLEGDHYYFFFLSFFIFLTTLGLCSSWFSSTPEASHEP